MMIERQTAQDVHETPDTGTNTVYESIVVGLNEAIEDAKDSDTKLRRNTLAQESGN